MKTKITLIITFILAQCLCHSQLIDVDHCVSASNLLQSGTVSVIDHPVLNGDPDSKVVLQKIRLEDNGIEINNPGSISLGYDSALQRWVIFDEDNSQLVVNACYNIIRVGDGKDYAFEVKCDAASIDPAFPNSCTIDYPEINDDSNSRCIYSSVRDLDNVINDLDIDLYYNYLSPGSWILWTLTSATLPVNANFNLICNPPGMIYYEHYSDFSNIDRVITSVTVFSLWTILTHPLLDNNPNAKIFVSHRREPSTDFFLDSHSVKYNSITGFWQIHWELETLTSSDLIFPTNRFWNVFIVDDSLSTNETTLSSTTIHPNPSNDVFNLESEKPITEVTLYNLLGQELQTIYGNGRQNFQIDLTNYHAGQYLAKVKLDNNIETVRLVKN
ncbi:T9SS type A sorting domain-containing protein [Winogradskyella sp. 3972H.M.0a.05]|uniref:T9SS type A sorting domain-containing protein n=1 Tax=Winogradskyella sp. 3972H.M.0a.05 TaxID=2950277 RepID=UPI0033977C8F